MEPIWWRKLRNFLPLAKKNFWIYVGKHHINIAGGDLAKHCPRQGGGVNWTGPVVGLGGKIQTLLQIHESFKKNKDGRCLVANCKLKLTSSDDYFELDNSN
jgi:hypothetical protein